jgi:acyl carrier protein
MDYLSTVREFVIETFLFGDEERLDDDASFIESGIVDSTGILELVAFLEETFDIIIEDEEVVPDNLDRLCNIVRFLEKKLNGKTARFS